MWKRGGINRRRECAKALLLLLNRPRDSWIAGSAEEVGDAGFEGKLPGEGVLARAGAEDENPHNAKP